MRPRIHALPRYAPRSRRGEYAELELKLVVLLMKLMALAGR